MVAELTELTTLEKILVQKIRALPDDKAAEVHDFIEFLSHQLTKKQFMAEIYQLAEPSFRKVWDNPLDAKYDDL
jgi:hypothetical protein